VKPVAGASHFASIAAVGSLSRSEMILVSGASVKVPSRV
jgi:hypothetical protein